jgi:hypothetical protein
VKNSIGLTIYLALVITVVSAQAQSPAKLAGCKTDQGQTTCDSYWFQKTLDTAQVVKVEYSERDRATGSQLKDLAKTLGKSVAKEGETPDLTFTVQEAQVAGVDIGPADVEILELRIYSNENSERKLIWVETYRGQKDIPWPANVHAAIEQFLQRLKKKS